MAVDLVEKGIFNLCLKVTLELFLDETFSLKYTQFDINIIVVDLISRKKSRWIMQIENALLTTIYSSVNCKQCSLRVISGSLTKQTRKRGTWPSLHVASGL